MTIGHTSVHIVGLKYTVKNNDCYYQVSCQSASLKGPFLCYLVHRQSVLCIRTTILSFLMIQRLSRNLGYLVLLYTSVRSKYQHEKSCKLKFAYNNTCVDSKFCLFYWIFYDLNLFIKNFIEKFIILGLSQNESFSKVCFCFRFHKHTRLQYVYLWKIFFFYFHHTENKKLFKYRYHLKKKL